MSVQLIHGDCLQVMPKLPDHSIDCIIADLPYGTTACSWDVVIPFEPLWAQYKRLIKPRGAIVLFGSQPFTTLLIASNLGWFKYCLVWEKSIKTGFQHAKNAPMKRHEDIAVFSDGVVNHESLSNRRMRYYPQFSAGLPYRKKVVRPNVGAGGLHRATAANLSFVGTVQSSDGARYPDTILDYPSGNHDNDHPNQKPVTLLAYLICTYTNPGDTILDNTCGSGSTLVACIKEERNGIGIESDASYYAIAQRRITEAQLQPRLLALDITEEGLAQ